MISPADRYDFFKDPVVRVKPEITFMDIEDKEAVMPVEPGAKLRVRVNGNYRVPYSGRVLTAKDRPFEMPDDRDTDRLIKTGVLSVVPLKRGTS